MHSGGERDSETLQMDRKQRLGTAAVISKLLTHIQHIYSTLYAKFLQAMLIQEWKNPTFMIDREGHRTTSATRICGPI